MDDEDIKRLGAVIRLARKKKMMTLEEVGDAIGVTPQAVGQWERGINGPTASKLMSLRRLLGDDLTGSGEGTLTTRTEIHPAGPEPSEVEPATNAPTLSQMGDFDVEVRGISVGGEDDEFYFNGEVIDHIRRPPGIKRAKNVFALNVSGESMMPRYEPGEPIYVQKTNPVAGDYVVVELYPEIEGQSGKAFLKQLVRRTGLRVICKQFNPPKEVEFDAGEVKDIYRVLKPKDLLG